MTQWKFDRALEARLELEFPMLKSSGYRLTSPPEYYYNCIAWAVGDQDRYWSPLPRPTAVGHQDSPYQEYWPPGAPQEDTLIAWKGALSQEGFVDCTSETLEDGFEKIAIYVDDGGLPQHVARQLPKGLWTSKLGDDCDLEHNTLRALEGERYGTAKYFMKRPVGN